MIEVFKTDVVDCHHAQEIVRLLHDRFLGYRINFDLDDCDHVLRVESNSAIALEELKDFLVMCGVSAEELPG